MHIFLLRWLRSQGFSYLDKEEPIVIHRDIYFQFSLEEEKYLNESCKDDIPKENNNKLSIEYNIDDGDHKTQKEILYQNKKKSLADLHEKIMNFQDCPLRFSAINTVCGEGNLDADLLFIGEAPGAQEDDQGRPFVGASGQLLEKMLGAIHLDRKNIFITNVIPWRPPFNRNPTPEEIQQCLPFVHEHISIIQPKILICLGSIAFHSLFPEFSKISITKAHDLSLMYTKNNLSIPTYVLYHPSYLLRSSAGKPKTWEQLKKLKKFYDSLQGEIVK